MYMRVGDARLLCILLSLLCITWRGEDSSKLQTTRGSQNILIMEKGSSTGRQRVRFAPKEYFLPRRPLYVSIGVNGACVLAGLGVGMLIENWIAKKVKEDGGYVTIGPKKTEVSETVATAPLQH